MDMLICTLLLRVTYPLDLGLHLAVWVVQIDDDFDLAVFQLGGQLEVHLWRACVCTRRWWCQRTSLNLMRKSLE